MPPFMACDKHYADARIALFGAPFDGTTSNRPDARFAPAAIRGESYGLETYSPYQDRDLEEIAVCDCGDLELAPGSAERAVAAVEACVSSLLADGKLPVMLGGEHLLTLGAVRAVLRQYPDLRVLQFDAHADLRDDYLGEKLSHATVMRRVWELGCGGIYQLGIRSGERSEFDFAAEHTHMRRYDLRGVGEAVNELANKPVYLTLDLDVLDPSVLSGTGTPEPGGVSFNELLDAVLSLAPLDIVGCDVVELSPHYDHSGASAAAACKILREILLILGG